MRPGDRDHHGGRGDGDDACASHRSLGRVSSHSNRTGGDNLAPHGRVEPPDGDSRLGVDLAGLGALALIPRRRAIR